MNKYLEISPEVSAALAWALLRGTDGLDDCARAGLAAASLAVESEQTVNPQISEAAFMERLEAIGSAVPIL